MDNLKFDIQKLLIQDDRLDRIEKLLISNKRVLTLEEACNYTGYSHGYMYKLTSSNTIPYSKPNGKFIFFSKEELENWLLRNPQKPNRDIEQEAFNHVLRHKR